MKQALSTMTSSTRLPRISSLYPLTESDAVTDPRLCVVLF